VTHGREWAYQLDRRPVSLDIKEKSFPSFYKNGDKKISYGATLRGEGGREGAYGLHRRKTSPAVSRENARDAARYRRGHESFPRA